MPLTQRQEIRNGENGKIAHEHIYWDQGSLLAQVGLVDLKLVPVIGAQQAATLRAKHTR